jgi:flavin reductase
MSAERDDFLAAMRRAASGVSIVTTTGPAGRAGVTVSAMCSVAADPPTLLACIHHKCAAAEKIVENGGFCVNLVAEDQQHLAEWFGGLRPPPDGDRFAGAVWHDLGGNGLALDGAIAALDCELVQAQRVATHYVMIGAPRRIRTGDGAALIYVNRSFAVARAALAEAAAPRAYAGAS